jgi:hypothetical protein
MPNANNGHKGKVFIHFAFSFFRHVFDISCSKHRQDVSRE